MTTTDYSILLLFLKMLLMSYIILILLGNKDYIIKVLHFHIHINQSHKLSWFHTQFVVHLDSRQPGGLQIVQ